MRGLALLALFVLGGCVKNVPLPALAERHRPTTDDGWEISMVRYRAVGTPTGRPVLLCHGISANDRNMDLDERHSLARWIAAHGREAWTVSLRGTGDSDRPNAKEGRAEDFTFDEYWKQDLPAAIHEIQRTTGFDDVDYIGHSMGGMVVYAYLAEGGTGLNAAATLGSPTTLAIGLRTSALLGTLAPVLSPTFSIPSGLGAFILSPLTGFIDDGPVELLLYNRSNTPHEVWGRLLAYGTADIAGGVAHQLALMASTGEFKSVDGAIDFKHDMATVKTPVLVVAARLDRTAPVPAVKDGYRALGGAKEWLLVSEANHAKAEYGHMDLVLGDRAGDEVWSKVLEFFDRHEKELSP